MRPNNLFHQYHADAYKSYRGEKFLLVVDSESTEIQSKPLRQNYTNTNFHTETVSSGGARTAVQSSMQTPNMTTYLQKPPVKTLNEVSYSLRRLRPMTAVHMQKQRSEKASSKGGFID